MTLAAAALDSMEFRPQICDQCAPSYLGILWWCMADCFYAWSVPWPTMVRLTCRGVVRGVAGVARATPIFQVLFHKTSKPQALKLLSPKALKPWSPQALKPLSPQALKLSTPQTIKPSNPQALKLLSPQALKPLSTQTHKPSIHQALKS